MTAAESPRKLRPWYLAATMGLMWVMGVTGAVRGCSNVSYLRGKNDIIAVIDKSIAQQKNPLFLASLVRERARLKALGALHERAFPLSIAQLLLCALLVLASGAALSARRNARSVALQAVLANAVLAVVIHVLLAPAHEATAQAVAVEVVDHGTALDRNQGREQSIALRRQIQLDAQWRLLLLEICAFGAAAVALNRARTLAYFRAVEDAKPKDPTS